MGMGMIGQQAQAGFQAPEPYVPESAKAAGALYEAGLAPSVINALQQAAPAPFDPVAYRNQFKPDSGGLAGIPAITEEQKNEHLKKIAESLGVPPISGVQPKGYETGGPTVEFLPARGKGEFSPRQQMPSFYQQPMGMMAQPFNPMGYGPMGMFMNPYGGGLGGMAYNFMNRPMPLYGQGGQFTAGQYQAPKPIAPTQPSFGFSPYGGFGYF